MHLVTIYIVDVCDALILSLGWLAEVDGDGDRAPPAHPQARLGIMWCEARCELWSDSKAQADPMVSRKTFFKCS